MSPKSLAWIVLGGCAFALGGLELAACSDSGGGSGTPTGGSDATVAKDGQGGDGSSTGDGSSKNDGSTVGDAGTDCGKAPTLHPRAQADAGPDGGDAGPIMNFLCPFSAPTGQPWDYCSSGTQHCCIPYAKGSQSTCESSCPNEADGGPFDGRDIQCLDDIDCTGGKTCCGTGQVLKDDTCGTYFGKGFKGSVCKTSCDANNNEFAICQSDSQCPSGKTCTPMSAVGAQFGFCQ